jgi:copper chaperone NosL
MNARHLLVAGCVALALAGTLSLPGCDDTQTLAPPTLHCGRDVCTECGMIINEARFAGAMIVEHDGAPGYQVFDDIGEMLDQDLIHPDQKTLARYVQDYGGGGWVRAESARYYVDPELHTPMGTGMVAFATDQGARDALGKPAVATLGLAEAREVRAKDRRERSGH